MPLPRRLAEANRRLLNPATRRIAPYMPGFGVVHHVGRKSGKEYATPIFAFRHDNSFVIALTYGTRTEWLANVLAAGTCSISTRGRTIAMWNPRVVSDPERAMVPAPVRIAPSALNVSDFLILDPVPVDSL